MDVINLFIKFFLILRSLSLFFFINSSCLIFFLLIFFPTQEIEFADLSPFLFTGPVSEFM